MKPAGAFGCVAATIFCVACIAMANDTDSSSGITGSSSATSNNPILLEAEETENLHGFDEDDDGLIDYLILEEGAT